MPGGPSNVEQESGISPRSIRSQAIHPRHLVNDLWEGKFVKASWPGVQPICHAGDGYSAPTAGDGDENVALIGGPTPAQLAYHVIVLQTALAPAVDETNGYLIATLDGGAGDGVEYVPGGITANSPFANVVGTGAAAYIKARLAAETVANVAELALGFRKAEAFQAAIDNYDEMAAFNAQGADIEIHTILNGGTTGAVDTGENLADAVFRTLEVWLMGRSLRFFVDGVQYKSVFQFDEDEVVVPFLHTLGVTGASELRITDLEVGSLWHVNKDINRR